MCILNNPHYSKTEKENSLKDFPIGKFMRFLKHLGLRKLLGRITDRRDPLKVQYQMSVILNWSLSIFFFRVRSLHQLEQAFDKVPKYRKQALWNFFGLPEGSSLPKRQTVTECLSRLDPMEINRLLILLIRRAIQSKVFYNHQHILGAKFYVACDGFMVHYYCKPHSVDEKGCNACPYCLPRVRNKGTSDEKTSYLHAFVNLAIILPGGIQLPLYVYCLKAQQLQGHETDCDDRHKQECELQAAKEIFPLIKQEFPRLDITLLTDSLYANEPIITLCRKLGWDFLIVRQEGSLKKLAARCDALEKTAVYEAYQAQESAPLKNGGRIERNIRWFNKERIGEEEVHVIRFMEVGYNARGEQEKCFKTEWLSSTRVSRHNCFQLTQAARRRADHEDLHNTCKNRGFHAKHDYARSNANAALIWRLLMFVAFWIFEFFSCTQLAQESKGHGTWRMLAEELLIDLLREPWESIALSPSLVKTSIQFRFNFSEH